MFTIKVKVLRVGGISKHKEYKPTGKIVSGSCDGIDPEEKYCVEVKVVTTASRLYDFVHEKKMILKSKPPLQELLRSMFVNDAEVGYLVLYYTNDSIMNFRFIGKNTNSILLACIVKCRVSVVILYLKSLVMKE